MSLRDQLLAKGLVSKKRARKAARELREARKAEQGSRRRQSELAREAEAQRQAEAEAEAERRRQELQARRAEREALEHRLRVRNLILGNRLPAGRGHRFFHRVPDSAAVSELQVSSGIAMALRNGDAALVQHDHGTWLEVVVVRRRAAEALQQLAPERIVLFVPDAAGASAPDLAFHQRDWPTELGPHRATDDDLERHRASVG
ncbi:MAG: DUF2058 domain-containing protein [Myxococcales bacterium]|nr:DUF2058 domain-containing protein [Myxococcales bacterium]